MIRRTIVVASLIACFTLYLFTLKTDASDRVGIYSRIDKIVFEPNATAPERIQIWGAFALAGKQDGSSYESVKRGYLYYSLKPGKEEVCRKEWADLNAIAGTGQVIGFGGRYLPSGSVRKAQEKATDPDVYPVGYGLVKMSDRQSDYPPIRELRSLPKDQK